jgi:hypothetical protein
MTTPSRLSKALGNSVFSCLTAPASTSDATAAAKLAGEALEELDIFAWKSKS